MAAMELARAALERTEVLEFGVVILFFHFSEYALAVAFHGLSNVTRSSLIIELEYVIMIGCAYVEYTIELAIFPALKNQWLSNVGLVMVLAGEAIRKIGILTAGRAFTHTIRTHHEDHHKLITHGIYKFMRHPGYCGYFIWAAGTQAACKPPKAIHGGIPICFPQFGIHGGLDKIWSIDPDPPPFPLNNTYRTYIDEDDSKIWPHSYDLMLTSGIGNTNTDGKPFSFFSVTDISEVRILFLPNERKATRKTGACEIHETGPWGPQ